MNINGDIFWLIISEIISICISIGFGAHVTDEESSLFTGILAGIALCAICQLVCFFPFL